MNSLPRYDSAELLRLIREFAYQEGDFTLASGAQAKFYLDCRRLTLHPRGLVQVVAGLYELLERDGLPDAVGGMAIGADPLTAGLVHRAGLGGVDMLGFMVRKEPKSHGTGKQVEGPVLPGYKVVVVEDVVTSGGSSVKAIQAAQEFGLVVQKVIAIVDRQAGGRESFEQLGIPFEALVTLEQIHQTLPR
jgi:orotate phosphoribosyltransferase